MSGRRGATSDSPSNPVLSGDRHATVAADTFAPGVASHPDPGPHGNGNGQVDREDEPERASIEEHRETVVRRLLERGLSPTTVATLLPDFRPLVQRLAEDE